MGCAFLGRHGFPTFADAVAVVPEVAVNYARVGNDWLLAGVNAALAVVIFVCVLLVEDESMIRQVMSEGLQDAGYEVVEAGNGVDALALIHNPPKPFSVLVTDFHMPGEIDGAQVAAQFRRVAPDIPVIIASGRPEVLKSAWQTELGYRLLKKPYLPSQLVTLIRSMVALSDPH